MISRLFYPENIKCICCGNELYEETENFICGECKFIQNDEFCLKCGRHIENMANYCDVCMNKKWEFDSARSAFIFDGDFKKVLHKLKFGGEAYLSKYIAKFLYNTYLSSFYTAELITFVPIHKKRARKRGFNQSELIAKELSVLLGLPMTAALEKKVKTKALSKLKAAERIKEISGAISLLEGINLKDKKVLLIDDMFTTGATSSECAKILKSAGAESVFVITAASMTVKPLLY